MSICTSGTAARGRKTSNDLRRELREAAAWLTSLQKLEEGSRRTLYGKGVHVCHGRGNEAFARLEVEGAITRQCSKRPMPAARVYKGKRKSYAKDMVPWKPRPCISVLTT